jgi:hypothetical protein
MKPIAARINTAYPIYALALGVPLFFASPQIVTGTIVNGLLFLAAKRFSRNERIVMSILSSLGALMHGVLFGPQTMFLLYFLPCIWIGNYLLMHICSHLRTTSYGLRVVISSSVKFLFLFLFAQLFFHLKIVPLLFVSTMGYIQLITALAGGFLSAIL